jgi:hypothetical protein
MTHLAQLRRVLDRRQIVFVHARRANAQTTDRRALRLAAAKVMPQLPARDREQPRQIL